MSTTTFYTVTVNRRAGSDCTRGGISSTHDRLDLVGIIREHQDPTSSVQPLPAPHRVIDGQTPNPAVVLVIQDLSPFCQGLRAHLAPARWTGTEWAKAPGYSMYGGNLAEAGWVLREAIQKELGYPSTGGITIHDRYES